MKHPDIHVLAGPDTSLTPAEIRQMIEETRSWLIARRIIRKRIEPSQEDVEKKKGRLTRKS